MILELSKPDLIIVGFGMSLDKNDDADTFKCNIHTILIF